jgi:hypothetical protein
MIPFLLDQLLQFCDSNPLQTLPYLIPDFFVATIVSACVVAAELAIISFSAIDSWIRHSSPQRFKLWSGVLWCSLRALRLAVHKMDPSGADEQGAGGQEGALWVGKAVSVLRS